MHHSTPHALFAAALLAAAPALAQQQNPVARPGTTPAAEGAGQPTAAAPQPGTVVVQPNAAVQPPTSAAAQQNPAVTQPNPASAQHQATDGGFFKPTPDGSLSLTTTYNPPPAPAPAPAAQPQVIVQPVVIPADAGVARIEQQSELDRRMMERQRLLDPTPPRINGAFTGSTDPRDR